MKKYSPALLSAILISALMVLSPVTQADEQHVDNANAQEEQSYPEKVGEKALSGFANVSTALYEIPKNIINTTNQSNVVFGFTGGLAKGLLNTMGRVMVGVADLATTLIITKPIVSPGHVWEDFDTDTTYGEVMRLDNKPADRFPAIPECDYLGPPC